MATISQETKDAVLSAADMVSVVGEYVSLEQKGNMWWGCCPFHHEKTPSFSVTPDKKLYYCFGCHEGGDIIKFIMEMEKCRYPEAIEFLARKTGIQVKYTDSSPVPQKKDDSKEQIVNLYNRVCDMFHYGLVNTDSGKFALEYIKKRGITIETIEKFKIGYSPADRKWLKNFLRSKKYSDDFLSKTGLFSTRYPDFAFFSDRLMFPVFDRNGQCVAFGGRFLRGDASKSPKYLNSGDLIQYQKRETLYAYNFAKNAIREEKKVIFCEGYMDCIAYHQCGINYAVASCGTALTEEQVKLVSGHAKTILLSFDSDGAGQAATWKAILMCRKMNLTVKVIRLHGGKDPAEIMLNLGKDVLKNDVDCAILDNDYLLNSLTQKYPVDTPEGKSKASLEFFQYIDALQTEIQRESCLDQLSQAFNITPEAVRRDFHNRQGSVSVSPKSGNAADVKRIPQLKKDAELRAVLAVISDTNQFALMETQLSDDDFDNKTAKYLFSILKECSQKGELNFNEVLAHCDDENIQQLIASSVASGEFSANTVQTVNDGIQFIKRNVLEKRRNSILEQIKNTPPVTQENQILLTKLLAEKMNIDKKLNKKD